MISRGHLEPGYRKLVFWDYQNGKNVEALSMWFIIFSISEIPLLGVWMLCFEKNKIPIYTTSLAVLNYLMNRGIWWRWRKFPRLATLDSDRTNFNITLWNNKNYHKNLSHPANMSPMWKLWKKVFELPGKMFLFEW